MSEAYGKVLVKASSEIAEKFLEKKGSISWSSVKDLFSFAGIASPEKEHNLLLYSVDKDFPHEGIKLVDGWLKITIFGDEWMHLMEVLTSKGKNVEAYGQIFHEHGVNGFYALNANGDRFFEEVDLEGDCDEDEDDECGGEGEVEKKWVSKVPKEIVKKFPDVFESDD